MPRLLQINSCLNRSTGRIAQQIGEAAIVAGYESVIAYPVRAGEHDCQSLTFRIGSQLDSSFHALMTRFFDRHGLESKRATRKLVERIEEFNPDILHLHNIHGYYINYPILFEYIVKKNVPVVWTFHDCWPFTGHCVHFTDVNCYKWEKGPCDNCPKKRSYPSSWILDRSRYNYIDKKESFTSLRNLTIVPVSYWLRGIVSRSFMKDYPIQVIQNGVDISAFSPQDAESQIIRRKYGLSGKFVILGVATGWSEDVGLSSFFRLRESLDDSYAIVMVGLSQKQLSSIPKGITGIPRTNDLKELAGFYSMADVLFNGSYQETFGLVTAEAMACGTPVIVYNSTACPEIVDNDRGIIIPVGDFSKLIEAIHFIRELPVNERNRMSASCVSFVRAHLDKNKKYQEYIELYNSLL